MLRAPVDSCDVKANNLLAAVSTSASHLPFSSHVKHVRLIHSFHISLSEGTACKITKPEFYF
jgi:hypothetical protein